MNTTPLLIPNLGAEESANWQKLLRQPAPATMARLWTLLFPASSPCEPAELLGEFPAALEAQRDAAAFRWLDRERGAIAWYSTAEAREIAKGAGLDLSGAEPEVVARVHDKAFAQRVAQECGLIPRPLRDLVTVLEPELLRAPDDCVAEIGNTLERWPDWTGGRFALKPRLATSGRGRVPGERDAFDEAALRGAFPRLAERGGALLEPWLDRVCDLSVQLHLEASGELTVLGTLEQILSASGLYQGHRGYIDWRGRVSSGSSEEEGLLEAGSELARASFREGFHGPCGVDAFVFRLEEDGEAREILRPVCEFNARFTTGTIVIGLLRRLLPKLGLQPGDRVPFEFALRKSRASECQLDGRAFPLDPIAADIVVAAPSA